MGNDGGSIPHRREVVKTKQKEERKENFEMARAKSKLCAISKTPLQKPLAACKLGLIYNKEEVIKRLIEKTIPHAFRHIKKLRDIKELSVETTENKEDGSLTIICPIAKVDFNGFNKFMFSWECGCVFSEEAAKELKIQKTCINCGKELDQERDIISLNQSSDQQLEYLKIVDEEQQKLKQKQEQKKANKKRKHREQDDGNLDEIEPEQKRQKTEKKGEEANKNSEAIKSLFQKQYEENKDTDFLCRCVHRGLR